METLKDRDQSGGKGVRVVLKRNGGTAQVQGRYKGEHKDCAGKNHSSPFKCSHASSQLLLEITPTIRAARTTAWMERHASRRAQDRLSQSTLVFFTALIPQAFLQLPSYCLRIN